VERRATKARWLLAGVVLLGWLAGRPVEVRRSAVDAFFGFLAGGVILAHQLSAFADAQAKARS
jgi:hypothetical protein